MRSTFTPTDAERLFESIGRPWWIAGGWAIDLWLGRRSREPEDLDVAILRRDLPVFRTRLEGWDLHLAHDDGLAVLAVDDDVAPPAHAVWCRPDPGAPWAFELLLNGSDGDDWVFRRDPSIRRSLVAISRTSDEGLPILAPEIVLLFKAKQHRPRDEGDFRETVPTMSGEQSGWLRASLERCHPGHPWLRVLATGAEALP